MGGLPLVFGRSEGMGRNLLVSLTEASDSSTIRLVLTYDLLEDRRTIDVITTKFFPLCFEMAESFENLDNVLHDWAIDKVQKSLVEALNRYEKNSLAGRRKIEPFLF